MENKEASPVVPLIAPKGDAKRRRRIEVLAETVAFFQGKRASILEAARANLKRWKLDASGASNPQPCEVLVVQADLMETVRALTVKHGTMFAALNMANERYPGGGYTYGCAAQEENMARRSDLHFTFTGEVVRKQGASVVYSKEMTALIGGEAGQVHLSSRPLVCVRGAEKFEEDSLGYEFYSPSKIFPFLELRSAAVDIGKHSGKRKREASEVDASMKRRIEAQFATLEQRNVRHVVLSAFGCGAFGNDPLKVASMYREAVERHKHNFDVIAFAIFYAGRGTSNFEVFKEVFGPGVQNVKNKEVSRAS